MTYTVYLFAILAVVGGIIAWLGDVLGARLGKRRNTVFGLRPRQSARLIAVLVGALLPLGGLLVATVGSQYARQAVFEMDSLLSSIDDLRADVDKFRGLADEARQAATRAEKDAAQSRAALVGAEEEVASLTTVQASLHEQVSGLEGQQASLEGLVAQSEQAVAQARGDLDGARADLDKSRDDLSVLEEERGRLTNENKTATDRLGQIEREIASAARAVIEAEDEVAGRERALQALQDEFADAQAKLDELRERDRLITGERAVFELGDELMRVVLDANETQAQMESELFELLHLASGIAQRRGVPVGPNSRAVTVVAPVPRQSAGDGPLPESVIVRHVASELRVGGPEQWVVVVRTFRRLFPDDETQLEVQFKAAPNERVFEKGEVIAELHIEANAAPADIFKTIYHAVTDPDESLVRVMAIARHMLPHPKTGRYGSADLDDMFAAVDEIRAGDGVVTVRITAARDTYTVGPLSIAIEVGEEDSP